MPFTIFITGVSSGFGLKLAAIALKQGAKVIGTVRDTQKASDSLAELTAISSNFHHVTIDMIDSDRLSIVLNKAVKDHGPIDVLINNAGYFSLGPLEHFTQKQARLQMETNFFAPLALMQTILPHFRQRKSGTIVNISSMAGYRAYPGCSMYSASKFGLEALSESLATEVATFGVRVILVEPGSFRTEVFTPDKLAQSPSELGWADEYKESAVGETSSFVQEADGKQVGDTEKAVQKIWEVVCGMGIGSEFRERGRDGRVLRVPLGYDALEWLTESIEMRREALKEFEVIAKSCNYDTRNPEMSL